jgi:hypothetical protein
LRAQILQRLQYLGQKQDKNSYRLNGGFLLKKRFFRDDYIIVRYPLGNIFEALKKEFAVFLRYSEKGEIMTNHEDLQNDAQSALSDVEKIRLEITQVLGLNSVRSSLRDFDEGHSFAEDLENFQKRAFQLLDRIYRLLHEIEKGNIESQGSAEKTAFSLSTLANELKAQLEWLKDILEHVERMIKANTERIPEWFEERVAKPVRSALQKLKSYLIPILKPFLSKIWQVISNLLIPTEWKLKGNVGTPILGLADVGIEITFGSSTSGT